MRRCSDSRHISHLDEINLNKCSRLLDNLTLDAPSAAESQIPFYIIPQEAGHGAHSGFDGAQAYKRVILPRLKRLPIGVQWEINRRLSRGDIEVSDIEVHKLSPLRGATNARAVPLVSGLLKKWKAGRRRVRRGVELDTPEGSDELDLLMASVPVPVGGNDGNLTVSKYLV